MDVVLHALADSSRRTVLDALRAQEATAGELAALLPISRPGVSRHLRVLREAGLVDVRQDAQRRIYSLRADGLASVDDWLEPYRTLWQQRFDALHTEVSRGKKARREAARSEPATGRASGRPESRDTTSSPAKTLRRRSTG